MCGGGVLYVSLPSSLELSEVLAGGTRIRPWLPGRPRVGWSTAARQAGAQVLRARTFLVLEFPNSPNANFLIAEFQSQLPPS